MLRPAIFLDRDGTITADTGYTYRIEEMELLPKAIDGLVEFARLGFQLIVVSNQGGLGLGKFTEEDVHAYHDELARRLDEYDVRILEWSFSPFHPRAIHPHWQGESECRKPSPGMLIRAAETHAIDLASSWMIGDRASDIEAGRRAGCRTILVRTGVTEKELMAESTPEFEADDLLDASRIISREHRPSP